MILTGPAIAALVGQTKAAKADGLFDPAKLAFKVSCDVEPFDPARVGPNSYDVRLAPAVKVYDKCKVLHDWYAERGWPTPYMDHAPRSGCATPTDRLTFWRPLQPLRMDVEEPATEIPVPEAGLTLYPGVPYLMQTAEWVEAYGLRPDIDGRSSCGRLFVCVHQTAGRGDDGFRGRFTCEVTVTWPVVLLPHDVPLAQVSFTTLSGEQAPYGEGRKYQAQNDIRVSGLFKDFERLRAQKGSDS